MDSRLQVLLDRDAIHTVLVRYATSLDSRDWDRLATCFCEDATADYGRGILEGPVAIVALCRRMLEPLRVSQHLLGSFEIEVSAETAESRCYFQAQHVKSGTESDDQLIIAGTYEDSLTKTAEGWRIRHRKLVASWQDGNPRLLEG